MKIISISRLLTSVCLISTLVACGGGGGDSKPAPQAANKAPVISSITEISAYERDTISISPTVSDSDGSIASYTWSQVSGPEVAYLDLNSATLNFTAPNISTNETLAFSLTVKDDDGATTKAEFSVNLTAYEAINLDSIFDPGIKACLTSMDEPDIGISTFTCENNQIVSLNDLASLVNIQNLNIRSANLSDTSGLLGLENLQNLMIHSNYFYHEFSVLGDMTQLTSLTLTGVISFSYDWIGNLTNLKSLTIDSPSYNLPSISFLLNLPQLEHLSLPSAYRDEFGSILAQLTKLKYLNIAGTDISNFTHLASLTKLTYLDLSRGLGNSEMDIAILENLSQLETLKLDYRHNLINTNSLAKLTNLANLSIVNTDTASLAFLDGMEKLHTLDASSNSRLSDISSIKNATSLTVLDISNNRALDDLSPLADVPSLQTLNISSLSNNQSIDLSALSSLTQLQELTANQNTYTNLDALENLSELTSLNLINTGLNTLPNFSGLSKLESLDISFNTSLSSLSPLASLTKLKELNIEYDWSVESLEGLANLTKLNILKAANMSLLDISDLAGLENITYIDLSNSALLTDVSPLSNLLSLQTLLLSNAGKLENIDALFGLTGLIELDLVNERLVKCTDLDLLEQTLSNTVINRVGNCMVQKVDYSLFSDQNLKNCIQFLQADVEDLTSLNCNYSDIVTLDGMEQLYNLTVLYLSGNNITDISALSGLSNLYELQLSGNEIADISPLLGLSNLRRLYMSENTVVSCEDLDTLQTTLNLEFLLRPNTCI